MDKSLVKENNFEPAPGGNAGAVNYGIPFGTPVSPDASQNPNHFSADSKSTGHFEDQKSSAKNSNKPLDPQIDKLFKKKYTPSPDEVMCALQYVLSNMVKKDKHVAKEIVLKNLKADPNYYSHLNSLNINDKKMEVDETKHMTIKEQFEDKDKKTLETKNILDEMFKEHKEITKREINVELSNVIKEMIKNKKAKRYEEAE